MYAVLVVSRQKWKVEKRKETATSNKQKGGARDDIFQQSQRRPTQTNTARGTEGEKDTKPKRKKTKPFALGSASKSSRGNHYPW